MEIVYQILKEILFGHPNINVQVIILIILVLMIFYTVIKYLLFWNKKLSYLRSINAQISNWPVTKGKILESAITQMPTGGECDTYPVFQVSYNFRDANNFEYVSSGFQFLEPLVIPERELKELILKYPAGSTVDVHYNPENPDESCLQQSNDKDVKRSISDSRRVCIVFGIMGSLMAAFSIDSWLLSFLLLCIALLFILRFHKRLWNLTGDKLPLIRRLGCLS